MRDLVSMQIAERFAAARAVADAVLYEGYVLYPYRASSPKNQTRWQFGVLVPRAFGEAEGSERWSMRTECLVDPGAATDLHVRIRCLQVQRRSVEVGGGEPFCPVDRLEVAGAVYLAWDEAVDQVVDVVAPSLLGLAGDLQQDVEFPALSESEVIHSPDGSIAGRVVRRRRPVKGRVVLSTGHPVDAQGLMKVAVCVENLTEWDARSLRRDEVMDQCLVAVHVMLALDDGVFLSLLDPPEDARAATAGCHNDGAFPVLIGDDRVMLSSPIILYDHPEVSPESPGDLYDSTEIDEILALRVLTLTDDEKLEARATDPRAAAVIDRCDEMSPEAWSRLHGTVRPRGDAEDTAGAKYDERASDAEDTVDAEPVGIQWWDPGVDASVDPWTDTATIAGVPVTKGDPVRLRPSRRSDAQDIFLDGRSATVAGVFADVDGGQFVAVTVDDDPATEALAWQGRYLFFHPDEIEPLSAGGAIQ